MSVLEQLDQGVYDDYRPDDRFYDEYEQFCLGLADEPPSLSGLDEADHQKARQLATFLDWKYQKGIEESIDRDIGTYYEVNEMLLTLKHPEEFYAWLGRLTGTVDALPSQDS